MAQAGLASRRAAEAMIVEGRVKVDNVVVTELSTRVDPATAIVHVDGERVPTAPGLVVVAMNTPHGHAPSKPTTPAAETASVEEDGAESPASEAESVG